MFKFRFVKICHTKVQSEFNTIGPYTLNYTDSKSWGHSNSNVPNAARKEDLKTSWGVSCFFQRVDFYLPGYIEIPKWNANRSENYL